MDRRQVVLLPRDRQEAELQKEGVPPGKSKKGLVWAEGPGRAASVVVVAAAAAGLVWKVTPVVEGEVVGSALGLVECHRRLV